MQISRSRLAFTMFVLLGINTMNFYDRQVPGAIGQDLRKDLQLTDLQLGWLTPAFLILYAIIGVPLGRWADVGRRTHILAFGVLLWSLMTAVSGMAWSFASLFVMRLGVGVGEASCAPAANSLIGDLFPREQRARAISIFMLGLPIGLALSFFVSGQVAHTWGWPFAFYVAAIPGLILGVLCFFLPEPERGTVEGQSIGVRRRAGSPLWIVLSIPTMWWIILSAALHNFNMYALGTFLSPFVQRYHGLNTAEAGRINGLLYGFGGLGLFVGGWLADRVAKQRASGRMEVATFALAVTVPCIYFALQQPQGSVWAFAAWMLPGNMLLYVYYSAVYATIQDIVEPALRGTAMAVYFFVMYLLGGALGPVVTGGLSDYFAQQAVAEGVATSVETATAHGLHGALFLIPALGVALVIVLVIGSLTVKRDQQRLQEWMQKDGVEIEA